MGIIMKPLLFPEASNLADLFDVITPVDSLNEAQTGATHNMPYVMYDRLNVGYSFALVSLRTTHRQVLNARSSGRGSFDFVQRDDMGTLVIWKYSDIIGSVWLALIPPEGMPPELRPVPFENTSSAPYVTELWHDRPGGGVNHLVHLMSQYELTDFLDVEELRSWSGDDRLIIRGNFERFSGSFAIATDDPELVQRILHAVDNCKNLLTLEYKEVFK